MVVGRSMVQQLAGAAASYIMGLLPNKGSAALGLLMVVMTVGALAALWLLRKRDRNCNRRAA